jgi:NADH:ubiquinone oxidoreductase subunit 4 (subunit M)
MLWLVQRLFYGPQREMTAARPVNDLDLGEIAVLVPLAVLMLVMGIVPNYWLRAIQRNSPVSTPAHEVRSIPTPLPPDPVSVRNVAEAHP